MRKFKKLISFWSIGVLLIIIFISFLKVINSDIKLAHQGIFIYQKPFSWVKYHLTTSLKKSYSKLFNKYKETGLPQRLLFINSQYEKKLLSKLNFNHTLVFAQQVIKFRLFTSFDKFK